MGKKMQPGAGVRDAMLIIYGQIVKVRNSDFLILVSFVSALFKKNHPKVYFNLK